MIHTIPDLHVLYLVTYNLRGDPDQRGREMLSYIHE